MTLCNLSTCDEFTNVITNIGGCSYIASTASTLNENLKVRVAKLIANIAQKSEIAREQLMAAKAALELHQKSSNALLSSQCNLALKNLAIPINRARIRSKTVAKENKEKYHLHRIKVVQEILDTEKTYCEHLSDCINHYLRPMKNSMDEGSMDYVSIQQWKEIFSTIEIIYNMHQLFLYDLEESMKSNINQIKEFEGEARIGDVFVRLIDCLRLYKSYISDYDKSISSLSDCLENQKFQDFIDHQHDTYQTLSLSSILITPIQRIPRYSLLLQVFSHSLSSSSPFRFFLSFSFLPLISCSSLPNSTSPFPPPSLFTYFSSFPHYPFPIFLCASPYEERIQEYSPINLGSLSNTRNIITISFLIFLLPIAHSLPFLTSLSPFIPYFLMDICPFVVSHFAKSFAKMTEFEILLLKKGFDKTHGRLTPRF